mgnify:CR=1
MGPKQIFCAPDRNSIIDELFSDEGKRDIGGDDEQLPPLRHIFY